MTLIPKAAMDSHTAPKDFRLISLPSFLMKTLESLIDAHLRAIKDIRLLSGAQIAYFMGKSTETALHEFEGYIGKSLDT